MKKLLLLLLLLIPINIKAISTSATSSILIDMDSKRVLYGNNIHEVRSVASISKIMTALVALENSKLNKKITIGDEIDGAYGSGIYIKKGEKLTMKDLLYGLMLRSGNDASLAIAYHTSGNVDKFVDKMNQKVKELNLKNTTFNNPNGLDEKDGNFSTAYDMAIIMSECMKNKDFRKIVNTEVYNLKTNMNTYIWHNKNKTLKNYDKAIGGKTGFTKKARRTLVNAASNGNLNLVAVTLNDGNDFKDHENLFEYGFNNFKNYEIIKKGSIKIKDDNYYKKYDLYVKNSFKYPLSKDEIDMIKIKYNLKKLRIIKNNKLVGTLEVYLADNKIYSTNIYVRKKTKKTFLQQTKGLIYDK